jgi:hypothetical protein
MRSFDRQRGKHRHQIARMLLDRERFAPLARAKAAQVGHDHAISCRELGYLHSPVVVTAAQAVQQE